MSSIQNKIKENINPNKVKKCRSNLEKLLDKHRLDSTTGSSVTHVTLDPAFPGKYSFDKTARKKLNKLVKEGNSYNINMSIAEKPKNYGPIKVDIDLEIPKDDYKEGDRLYDSDFIMKSIELYRESIKKYLDIHDSQLQACVLEKSNVTNKGITVRDGIHIFFPYVVAHYKVRHLIREEVVTHAKDIEMFAKFTKNVEEIFDKSVISSNFWLMYGNSKPKCPPYKLTQLIAHDDSELEFSELINEEDDLVDIFSLQNKNWKETNATPLNSLYSNEDIDFECDNKGIDNSTSNSFETIIPESREDEFRKAKYLVSLLSDERAANYNDWIRTGWALHNTDSGLLQVWIDFSKKCPTKFNEKECHKLWMNMKQGLTIRSLQSWAKEDNPHKYSEYMKTEFEELLKKSLSGDTYSVAKALYTKYFDRFICASIKHNTWYEFKNHRWTRVDGGYTLMKLISEEFVNDYMKVSSEYNLKAINTTGIEREDLQKKASSFQRIVDKLLNLNFKKQIMEEGKYLFHDEDFEEKLDENHDLLGCDNGVYDFAKGEFREGRQDDYITLSTDNKYFPWNPKNAYAKSITTFFEEILPDKQVREYFLQALSTCLTGHNREEKLYIPSGGGSNGKSLTFELVNLALGSYYISCPVTIMTRGRGSSGAASPELARIKGKRIGVLQEPDNSETMNVGLMKELTGNDAFMARGLFQEPMEIKPQIKFFLTCNDLPIIPSRDGGTWRRLRVVEFKSKFVDVPSGPNQFKIDTKLKEKIVEWGPMFLSYLVYIYNTMYKKASYLHEPDQVLYSTNAYQMDNDHFLDYFNTKIEEVDDPKAIISKRSVYTDFKAWFKEYHEGNKLPRSEQLYRFLDDVLGKASRMGWKNVVFKTEEGGDSDDEVVNNLDI
jgi:P4 family phage/plasmid primase-like protien